MTDLRIPTDGGRVHVSEAWWSSWGQAVPARVPQKGVGGETGRDLVGLFLLRESRARRALTFNEPDGAMPELAGQNFCVILPEGLHKKSGSSTLSGARVAQEASEGRPLKLGCATTRRARLLGKCIWGWKFLDRPPLPKTYSRGIQIHPKLCFLSNLLTFVDFDEKITEFSVLQR